MIEQLTEKLNKIGWDIKGRYPNRFIYDHEGKRTIYRVWNDGIEPSGLSKHTTVRFEFKGSKIEMVENDAVSIGTPECFILFMNHDLQT